MLRGSSMPVVATCSGGSGDQGEKNVRGSSMRMGSSITGLYITTPRRRGEGVGSQPSSPMHPEQVLLLSFPLHEWLHILI
jgi:hypothetical protein